MIPALNSTGITENTTKENLPEMAENYWSSLNAECSSSDCTGGSTIKADALLTLGDISIYFHCDVMIIPDGAWVDDSDAETITGLLTTFRDTVNTNFIAHFRSRELPVISSLI